MLWLLNTPRAFEKEETNHTWRSGLKTVAPEEQDGGQLVPRSSLPDLGRARVPTLLTKAEFCMKAEGERLMSREGGL